MSGLTNADLGQAAVILRRKAAEHARPSASQKYNQLAAQCEALARGDPVPGNADRNMVSQEVEKTLGW
jgi:hypothetical protein